MLWNVVLLAVNVSFICYIFWSVASSGKRRQLAVFFLVLLALCSSSTGVDKRALQKSEKERRVMMVTVMNVLFLYFGTYNLVNYTVSIHQDGIMGLPESIVGVPIFIGFGIILLKPTQRCFLFLYSAFIIYRCICPLIWTINERYIGWVYWTACLILAGGVFITNSKASIICSSVGTGLDVFTLAQGDVHFSEVAVRIALGIFSILLFAFVELLDTRRCQNAFAAKDAKVGETTVHALLETFCDAAVTLAPDLRITAPSPSLAALLLQPEAHATYGGRLFTDLMVEDDRDLFEKFIARLQIFEDGHSRSKQAPLGVRLRAGSTGIQTVRCVLHHVSFVHVSSHGEEVRHLVGVCETGHHLMFDHGAQLRGNLRTIHENPLSSDRQLDCGVRDSPDDGAPAHDLSNRFWQEAARSRDTFQSSDEGAQLQFQSEHVAGQISRTYQQKSPGQAFPTRQNNASDKTSVKVRWQSCQSFIRDGSHALIHHRNLLDSDETMKWITSWSSTSDWVEDLQNVTLASLLEQEQQNLLTSSYTVECTIFFSTQVSFTKDTLSKAKFKPSRTGIPTDPRLAVPMSPVAVGVNTQSVKRPRSQQKAQHRECRQTSKNLSSARRILHVLGDYESSSSHSESGSSDSDGHFTAGNHSSTIGSRDCATSSSDPIGKLAL